MPGPPPKDASQRRRRNVDGPARGDWLVASGVGWQHGETPAPPDGLMPASVSAWSTWFAAWFAAYWTPADLPALRQVIRLYDQVERGGFTRAAELRLWTDSFGITPKGRQDRRWRSPDASSSGSSGGASSGTYGHLRSVPAPPSEQGR